MDVAAAVTQVGHGAGPGDGARIGKVQVRYCGRLGGRGHAFARDGDVARRQDAALRNADAHVHHVGRVADDAPRANNRPGSQWTTHEARA